MDGWMEGGREGEGDVLHHVLSLYPAPASSRFPSACLRRRRHWRRLCAARLCRRAGPSGRRLAWPTGSAGRRRSTFRVRWGRREGGSEEAVRRLRLCPRAGRRWAEPAAASRGARAAHGCGEAVSSEPARDQVTDTRTRRRVLSETHGVFALGRFPVDLGQLGRGSRLRLVPCDDLYSVWRCLPHTRAAPGRGSAPAQAEGLALPPQHPPPLVPVLPQTRGAGLSAAAAGGRDALELGGLAAPPAAGLPG